MTAPTHHDDSGVFDLRALLARRDEARSLPPGLPEWAELAPPAFPVAPVSTPPWREAVHAKHRAPAPRWLVSVYLGVAVTMLAAVAYAHSSELALRAPDPMTLHTSERGLAPLAGSALAVVHLPRAKAATVAAPEAPRRGRTTRAVRPAPASAPRPVATSGPAHSWDTGGADAAPVDRSIDELLDQALGDATDDPRPTPSVSLPEAPTARQVSTTLRALDGEVAQCIERDVTVRLLIAGATGAVTSATVSGAEDAAAASCVAGVVRTARFPRFERDSFSVTFPYRA